MCGTTFCRMWLLTLFELVLVGLIQLGHTQGMQLVPGGVLVHPKYLTVKEGRTALLHCRSLASPPAKVYWKRKLEFNLPSSDLDPSRMTALSNGTLVINPVASGDNGMYECRSSFPGIDNVAKKSATLNVLEKIRVDLIRQVTSQKLDYGRRAYRHKVKCYFKGHGIPRISWSKEGLDKLPNRMVESGSMLYIKNLTYDDGGVYTCTATGPFNVAVEKVNVSIFVTPMFTIRPADTTIVEGESAWIYCGGTGRPKPTIHFGEDNEQGDVLPSNFKPLANGTLFISKVKKENAGEYFCSLRNGRISSTTFFIMVEVLIPPMFTIRPADTTIVEGESTWIYCGGTGRPKPTINFGQETEQGDVLPSNFKPLANGTLFISKVKKENAGEYFCTLGNGRMIATTFFIMVEDIDVCIDKDKSCVYYKNFNYCESKLWYHRSFMKDNCALTCGTCKAIKRTARTIRSTSTKSDACINKDADCDYYKGEGYCDTSNIYYPFMTDDCALSCGFCKTTKPTTRPIPTAPAKVDVCIDKDESCDYYKERHYCDSKLMYQRSFMKDNCALTCGTCKAIKPTTQTIRTTTTKSDVCIDKDGSCDYYKKRNYCDSKLAYHRSFMKDNCALTCGTCKTIKPADCKLTTMGKEFRGIISTTITGKTCQAWDSQTPHKHNRISSKFPNAGLVKNYCRNPDNSAAGPWCYTMDSGKRWEYCNVRLCSGCKDENVACPTWKVHCKPASTHWKYMKKNCRKTCDTCKGPTGGSCGRSYTPQFRSTFIISGTDAKPGAWPWMASLARKYTSPVSHICGASLITPKWVLTASHCVESIRNIADWTIRLGDHDHRKKEGWEQIMDIRRIIMHPRYSKRTLFADMALIELKKPAKLNKRVQTICLPKTGNKPPLGSNCYMSGWGSIRHPGRPYPVLQQARVPIVARSRCRYSREVICAGYGRTSRINACRGDSGGPLVCQQRDGSWVQHGVASFVVTYCKYYTGFSPVNKYRNWITQYVPL